MTCYCHVYYGIIQQKQQGEMVMLDYNPSAEELVKLVGKPLYDVWTALTGLIDAKYDTERLWNSGGKAWKYEYKYRRGGKTLCSLYARGNCIGFMVIFGKDERTKFEEERDCYSKETQTVYDKAQTFHDGKWMMFEPTDAALFSDFMRLLHIKRKPNKV